MTIQNIKIIEKLNDLKPSPKYQILNENNEVHFEFHSIDWLLTSEIFTYIERQQLRTFKPISEGRYKGYRLTET